MRLRKLRTEFFVVYPNLNSLKFTKFGFFELMKIEIYKNSNYKFTKFEFFAIYETLNLHIPIFFLN